MRGKSGFVVNPGLDALTCEFKISNSCHRRSKIELLDSLREPYRGKGRAAPIRTGYDGIARVLLMFLAAGMPSRED